VTHSGGVREQRGHERQVAAEKKCTMPHAELEKNHTVQLQDNSSAMPSPSAAGLPGKGLQTDRGLGNRRGKKPNAFLKRNFSWKKAT